MASNTSALTSGQSSVQPQDQIPAGDHILEVYVKGIDVPHAHFGADLGELRGSWKPSDSEGIGRNTILIALAIGTCCMCLPLITFRNSISM